MYDIVSNTKTIAKYEEEHIEQIDKAVEKILASHESQVGGLARAKNKNGEETEAMINKARKKLSNKVTVTYLEHKNLSSTYVVNGQRKNYLWGVKTYADKIQPSVDVAIAHWATETLDKIINSPEILDKLAKKLNAEYPENGNFYDLEEKIKGSIIIAVTQYGINNIGKILDAKITKNYAKSIAKEIIADESLFNAAETYRIEGLNNNFGQYGHMLELFKDVHHIEDLQEKSAEKLYYVMNKLIQDMNSERGLTKEQSFLREVYKKNRSWRSIEDMMSLIARVEQLQNRINELQKKLDNHKISVEKILNTTISAGGSEGGKNYMELKLEVVNNKIQIVMDDSGKSLGQMISSTADFRRFGFKNFNPNSLKGAIMTLKSRASQELKKKLIEGIEVVLNDENFGLDHDYILSQIKQGFQNLKVSIGGPKLSELAAGLHFRKSGNDLIVDWAGGINGKNDVVSININADNVARSIKLQLRNTLDKKIAAVVEPEIMEARKAFLEQWNADVKSAIQYHTRNDTTNKYSELEDVFSGRQKNMSPKLNEKYEELKRIWERLEKEMIEQGKSQEEISFAQKKFLNVLGDSFYVSTTVKTYNEYQNNIGFGGGSIGTNLDDQLSRLADIFEQGGLSIKEDLEWLRFAIINCSPLSVLGESNKNLIEDYLGSLAAFTLFDEGGVEAAIIKKFQDRLMKNQSNMGIPGIYNNPSILHLYKVNGIYVPGSYVIQQIQKCIARDILPQIDEISATLNHGAGITIINQVFYLLLLLVLNSHVCRLQPFFS